MLLRGQEGATSELVVHTAGVVPEGKTTLEVLQGASYSATTGYPLYTQASDTAEVIALCGPYNPRLNESSEVRHKTV